MAYRKITILMSLDFFLCAKRNYFILTFVSDFIKSIKLSDKRVGL